jgi:predicted HAD superfamily Cof-like phosphohydrolase
MDNHVEEEMYTTLDGKRIGKQIGNKEFTQRIEAMNKMYKLPMHVIPILPADPVSRLQKFKKTLIDEVNEIDAIVGMVPHATDASEPAVIMTAIADLLGDVVVYCYSEALKYGIPLDDVLHIIMDSNESKLGADGEPIYNAEGKFLKGPNYFPPEPAIEKRLNAGCGVQQGY